MINEEGLYYLKPYDKKVLRFNIFDMGMMNNIHIAIFG